MILEILFQSLYFPSKAKFERIYPLFISFHYILSSSKIETMTLLSITKEMINYCIDTLDARKFDIYSSFND